MKFCGVGEQLDYLFLAPVHILIKSISDDENEKHDLLFDDMCVNMCPAMLNSLLNVTGSIGRTIDNLSIQKAPAKKPTKTITTCGRLLSFDDDDFWFTKPRQRPKNPDLKVKIPESKPYSTHLSIVSKTVSIKLEADIAEQLPLIGMNVKLVGDFKDYHKNVRSCYLIF